MRKIPTPPSYQKCKICYVILFLFISSINVFSQINNTPDNVFDKVFDRYGNSYQLNDLQKTTVEVSTNNNSNNRFNLYFETGCGMENHSNTIQFARKQVLIKVLQDVSNFIDLPISNNKVNIWIRNINNITETPNTRLGMGSSFYVLPKSNAGDIADGEVWKSILSGVSSYKNITLNPNNFYHGVLAFNFNNLNGIAINYHTNLTSNPSNNTYDLYSVMLKEVMHMLGVTSLMNQFGNSVFGIDYKYYSRYDMFLCNSNGTSLIKNINQTSMYGYNFNNVLPINILRPNCSLPNFLNTNNADNTTCSNYIIYRGSVTIPVYRPNCFEIGISLSCLEDQIYPSCSNNYGNNKYFAISNKTNISTSKRYPKPEERILLNDLGYKLKNIYGSIKTFDGNYKYNEILKNNNQVVGINDGLNTNNILTFIGNIGENITINGNQILSNDSNATLFEGLIDLTAASNISQSSGINSTIINFSSTEPGLHILKYVPKNNLGISGNITYLYIYLKFGNECGTIQQSCNLVINGSFEQFLMLPDAQNQVNRACNWEQFGFNTPDYYHSNSSNNDQSVPNNQFGNQQTTNPSNNLAYVGFFYNNHPNIGNEIIRTELHTPLIANTNYQLSFVVSKSEILNCRSSSIEAFITAENIPQQLAYTINQSYLNSGIYLVTPNISNDTENWETITFNFIATGGEKFLYLGGITKNHIVLTNPNDSCSSGYYYIDNVVLINSNNINNIANNDTLSLTFAATTQISTINVLQNDTINGVVLSPPFNGCSVTQIGNVTPTPANGAITINSAGNVVSTEFTTPGTYTLTYKYTSECGESNNATVTVNINTNGSVFQIPHKFQYLHYPCFNPASNNRSIYNLQDWQDGGFGQGILLNNVPISLANTTVSLVPGQNIPSGFSFNANGILTIPNNAYGEFNFFVIFCSITHPNICTPPIRIYVQILNYFLSTPDHLIFNALSVPTPGNPTNVLTNDLVDFCWWNYPNSGTPAILNVNCTLEILYTSQPSVLSVNPSNGNIELGSPIPGNEYYVLYRLCHPTLPSVCNYTESVRIFFY